jgi:hypothetical protein
MENVIDLQDIKKGFPGISLALCNSYYEACMVCLHRSNHRNFVLLNLGGDTQADIVLNWDDYFDDQIDRSWQDQTFCTDHGAVCLSAMLVKKCTDYTIIERARIGTGVDYWLSKKDDDLFHKSARLEISGILKESESNTVTQRFKIKKKQTNQSDATRLPVYISIIEFSNPKAIFAKK